MMLPVKMLSYNVFNFLYVVVANYSDVHKQKYQPLSILMILLYLFPVI